KQETSFLTSWSRTCESSVCLVSRSRRLTEDSVSILQRTLLSRWRYLEAGCLLPEYSIPTPWPPGSYQHSVLMINEADSCQRWHAAIFAARTQSVNRT